VFRIRAQKQRLDTDLQDNNHLVSQNLATLNSMMLRGLARAGLEWNGLQRPGRWSRQKVATELQ
jgi:hypothetical protein